MHDAKPVHFLLNLVAVIYRSGKAITPVASCNRWPLRSFAQDFQGRCGVVQPPSCASCHAEMAALRRLRRLPRRRRLVMVVARVVHTESGLCLRNARPCKDCSRAQALSLVCRAVASTRAPRVAREPSMRSLPSLLALRATFKSAVT